MKRPRHRSLLRRARVWCVPTLLLLALALPGLRGGDWRIDTGRYSAIGLSAWSEGSWWTLAAGDRPYFNKPPLAFWIHGLPLRVFGPELWAARLPVVLAAAGCVALTALLVRRLAGPRVAMAAGIVLALTPEWFRHTTQLSLDIWQTLLLLAAATCVATGARRDAQAPVVWSGVFVGLALLVKPLMALVAPVLLAVWLLALGKARLLKGLALSVVLALAVALPWHLSMVSMHGRAFTHQYFGNQIVERAAGVLFDPKPWWWYADHFVRSYWPWLATLALACVALARRGAPRRDRSALLLCLVWCAAWFVLLSAFADKRARYALLIYPFLSIASAVWLVKLAPLWVRRGGGRKWLDAAAGVAACIGLVGALTPLGPRLHEPPEKEWAALNALLRTMPNAPLYDDALDLADRSRLYLEQRRWTLDALAPGGPAAGSIVVRELGPDDAPGKWGGVVFREGALVAERAREAATAPGPRAPARRAPRQSRRPAPPRPAGAPRPR